MTIATVVMIHGFIQFTVELIKTGFWATQGAFPDETVERSVVRDPHLRKLIFESRIICMVKV